MAEIENRMTPWPEEEMEHYRWLDALLQEQPATERVFQPAWQAYRYLLGGKMYAYIGINDRNGRPIITLKLEPAFSDMLRQQYEDIEPGYYMNKLHWSSAYLDGNVPQEVLAEMVRIAYQGAVSSLSKKVRQAILGE